MLFFFNHKEPYFSRKEGERRKQVSGWGGTYTERLPSGLYNVHSSSRLIFIIMLWIVNQLRFHLKNNTMRYILLPLFYRWGSERQITLPKSHTYYSSELDFKPSQAGIALKPGLFSSFLGTRILLPMKCLRAGTGPGEKLISIPQISSMKLGQNQRQLNQ